MNVHQKYLSSSLLALAALLYSPSSGGAAGVAPSLGVAQSFAVLGASTVTCIGASAMTGDVGVSPGTAITGFPAPCTFTGAIHAGDAVATPAHSDAINAYNELSTQVCDFNYAPVAVLTDVTLTPGVHCFPTSLQVNGTLTLDGAGVFVFKIGTTLITAMNAHVLVSNDGLACDGINVFWAVGTSATLGTGTAFAGHILADQSITMTTGTNLSGSAIALNAAVTMDTNQVSVCSFARPRTDVNGDGRADLVWLNTMTGAVALWLQDGFTTLAGQVIATVPLTWQLAGVGDVNGDGRADLVWRNTMTNVVTVWLQDGFTTLAGQGILGVPPTWQIDGVGDFNGDRRADLIWRDTTTGQVILFLLDGFTTLAGQVIATMPLAWQIEGVGDVNGDGRADLVWRNTSTGAVALWLQNGFTTLAGQVIATMPMAWQLAGVGDVNGDGRADLVWRNTSTGAVALWLQNGFTTLAGQVIATMPMAWQIAGVGDVNGDGRADLVWRNTSTGAVALWLQNGFTTLAGQVTATVPVAWSIIKGEE